jgi:predicted O-methyltransferase YrrM
LLRPGGLLIADNALWGGRVLDPATEDEGTRGVREFNRRLANDTRVLGTIVPVGDGLGLAVVRLD